MQSTTGPFVFVIGKDIFVSPNVQRGPTWTELQQLDEMFSDPLLPSDALHLRFASNRFPYLAFAMPHARYKSTILKPLDYSKYSLPIKMIGGQYCLDPAVAESWAELEMNLAILVSKLLGRYTPHMDIEFEAFPRPADYGYSRGRHTEDGMRKAAMRGRKAFAPLIAMCSYAVAMTPKFTEEAPEWVDYLGKNGAHPRWLQELRRTPIVNFSKQSGRLGCVVRAKPECHFLKHIQRFVRANVPVWLVWNMKNDYEGTACAVYQPSEQAVADAQRRAHQVGGMPPAPHPAFHHRQSSPLEQDLVVQSPAHPASRHPPIPALYEPPEPESNSAQHKGETVHQFMERRAQMDLAREQTESAAERAARMQKVAAAATYALPGKSGARVFEWEMEGTYWIRKAMPRGYVQEQWGSMAHGHLRYNSFRNEWDYCELFDPDAEPPTDDDDYDDFEQDYFHGQDSLDAASQQTPCSRKGVDALPPTNTAFGTTNLHQAYVDRYSGGVLTQPEPMAVVLRLRYGFCGASGPPVPDESSWHYARKTLSDTESPWPWPELQGQVCNFVRAAVSGSVPPELWDLDPSSASPITFFSDDLVVERVTNGKRVFYRVVPRHAPGGEEQPWDLLVPDAITAVECLRRSHGSLGKAALVHFFSQTGRPFSTRKPIHPPPPPARVPRHRSYFPDGLSERHQQYVPDELDYKGYERDRAAFLLSDRGRAAIQEGGIVWRLAVEHLRLDDILGGPVDLAAAIYERFDGEPVGGWDDQLTDAELNLICGVYRIITGEEFRLRLKLGHG